MAWLTATVAGALLYWFGLPHVIRWLRRTNSSRARQYATAAEIRRFNKHVHVLMALGGVAILAGPVALEWDPQAFIILATSLLTFAFAATFFHGLRGRRGRDPSCARCGYPAGPEPSQWITCPECGADLSKPMAVILGRDVRRPHLIALGALGYAASVAGFVLL